MGPVHVHQAAPPRHPAPVAGRKAEAGRARIQVGHQRTEQRDTERERRQRLQRSGRTIAADRGPLGARQPDARPDGENDQQGHRRAEVQDHRGRRQLEPHGHRTEEHLHDQQQDGEEREDAQRAPDGGPSRPPGHGGQGDDEQAHGQSGQPVPVLDERVEVHRRDELAVAERPIVAAAHAAAGDADDPSEDDEGVGGHGGYRGQRAPTARIVAGRFVHESIGVSRGGYVHPDRRAAR